MRHDIALRLYDVGWIVGASVAFMMSRMMEMNIPWEIAMVVVLLFLGICRWVTELVTAPPRKVEKKVDEKKEDKKDEKKPEKKEVRHERRKDGRKWF